MCVFPYVAWGGSASADGDFRTVAITESPVWSGGSNYVIDSFTSAPTINSQGQVAFQASLEWNGFTEPESIWSEGAGNGLELLIRQGQTPLGSTYSFASFGPPVLNEDGVAAFKAELSSGFGETSIWAGDDRFSLRQIARDGEQAVGFPPDSEYDLYFAHGPAINSAGLVAFEADLQGSGVDSSNDKAIWAESAVGNLQLLAREGDPAPGVETGVVFGGFFNSALFQTPLSPSGHTVFYSRLRGPGLTPLTSLGIWSGSVAEGLRLIARGDGLVPGTPDHARIEFFSDPTINREGQVAFHALLSGPGAGVFGNQGILSEGGGNGLDLIARTAEQAAGVDPGIVYGSMQDPLIAGSGDVAFVGRLVGAGIDMFNDTAIWSGTSSDDLRLVARDGDPAPGVEPGVVFARDGFLDIAINDAGRVAFAASLEGPGVEYFNRDGVWAEDANGELQLIFRTGDLIDVDDSPLIEDFRRIESLQTSFDDGAIQGNGNGDGRRSAFNVRGELALGVRFDDSSSAVLVSNRVRAPIAGDYDSDGDVDTDDYSVWSATYGESVGPGEAADGNQNGAVGAADYTIWRDAMEASQSMAGTVPEPDSALLLIAAMSSACSARRMGGLTGFSVGHS